MIRRFQSMLAGVGLVGVLASCGGGGGVTDPVVGSPSVVLPGLVDGRSPLVYSGRVVASPVSGQSIDSTVVVVGGERFSSPGGFVDFSGVLSNRGSGPVSEPVVATAYPSVGGVGVASSSVTVLPEFLDGVSLSFANVVDEQSVGVSGVLVGDRSVGDVIVSSDSILPGVHSVSYVGVNDEGGSRVHTLDAVRFEHSGVPVLPVVDASFPWELWLGHFGRPGRSVDPWSENANNRYMRKFSDLKRIVVLDEDVYGAFECTRCYELLSSDSIQSLGLQKEPRLLEHGVRFFSEDLSKIYPSCDVELLVQSRGDSVVDITGFASELDDYAVRLAGTHTLFHKYPNTAGVIDRASFTDFSLNTVRHSSMGVVARWPDRSVGYSAYLLDFAESILPVIMPFGSSPEELDIKRLVVNIADRDITPDASRFARLVHALPAGSGFRYDGNGRVSDVYMPFGSAPLSLSSPYERWPDC